MKRAGLAEKATFDTAVTVLAAVAGAAALLRAPFQNDTWWQLRVGEDLVRHGRWPWHDHFTFTFPGAYFPHHEWLSSVAMYILDAAFGHAGPTVLAAATVFTAATLVWRRMYGRPLRRLGLFAVAAPVLAAGVSVRPTVFGMLFAVVTVQLLETRRYVWLPLVVLLWANLHGSVTLGDGIIVAALIAAAIKPRDEFRRLLPWAALAGAVTFVTPLGFGLLSALSGVSGANAPEEFRPSWQVMPDGAILAIVVVGWIIAVLAVRRTRAWPARVEIAAALALVLPAIRYVRIAPVFVLVALPLISRAIEQRWPERERARDEGSAAGLLLIVMAVVLGVVLVSSTWVHRDTALAWEPVPPRVYTAVRHCPGNLYNRFDDGGYLIWFTPERRVFIDSRYSPFPEKFVDDHVRDENAGDYRATFARWNISCAFLPVSSPTAQALVRDHWTLVGAGGKWLVLQKP
jgi:hypothetical protein